MFMWIIENFRWCFNKSNASIELVHVRKIPESNLNEMTSALYLEHYLDGMQFVVVIVVQFFFSSSFVADALFGICSVNENNTTATKMGGH